VIAYLLDINVLVALLRGKPAQLIARLAMENPAALHMSSIVLNELYYGAHGSSTPVRAEKNVDDLNFPIVIFDAEDARMAGKIRRSLRNTGTLIGPYDMLIAGQALARDMTLVTHSIREFSCVPDLKLVDWQGRAIHS
jgi:tRNA(fMet)-specific endonuclease VapC